jgi:adenine deaminase
MYKISGVIADVIARRFYPGEITVENGRISGIEPTNRVKGPFILPGLVDAHVHIESSMLVPSEFARAALVHGTVATVSDPHEIANVLGINGIQFMIENGASLPFKFFFGAPSCVPATSFESSGAVINAAQIDELLSRDDIAYLSEMMNFPGVIYKDSEVIAKLEAAARHGKPVDGHAPGLSGESLRAYASAGITTDHECFSIDEAREKILHGMKIQIREGSAARNFDVLIPLLREAPEMIMFCSDDKHPDDLIEGHINLLLKKAVGLGYDFFDCLRACTLNPREHYGLPTGLLQVGDPADFILVDNLDEMNVLKVYVNGALLAENGHCLIDPKVVVPVNHFVARPLKLADIQSLALGTSIRVIGAIDGEIITSSLELEARIENGMAVSDPDRDILKLVVYSRYREQAPAIAFIRGFGLKNAALASTVAHDSHNIIAVGSHDEYIIKAINLIVENKGGIVFASQEQEMLLPLPVGGLMTDLPLAQTAARYKAIDSLAKQDGCTLKAPLMTLSFMALLVIPDLKLSDQGLFDGRNFKPTGLYLE